MLVVRRFLLLDVTPQDAKAEGTSIPALAKNGPPQSEKRFPISRRDRANSAFSAQVSD